MLPQEKSRTLLDSDDDMSWPSTIEVSTAATTRTSASVETQKNNDAEKVPGGSATYGGTTLACQAKVDDETDVGKCSVAPTKGCGFSTEDQNGNSPEDATNAAFCQTSVDSSSKVNRTQLTSTSNLALSSGIAPKTEPGKTQRSCQIDYSVTAATVSRGTDQLLIVEVEKDSTGVGFSIEGGKQSLDGDRPIVIKRLFSGTVKRTECVLITASNILRTVNCVACE